MINYYEITDCIHRIISHTYQIWNFCGGESAKLISKMTEKMLRVNVIWSLNYIAKI